MSEQVTGCAGTYVPYSHSKQTFLVIVAAVVMIEEIVVAIAAILVAGQQ
jgi:hypothetical protein